MHVSAYMFNTDLEKASDYSLQAYDVTNYLKKHAEWKESINKTYKQLRAADGLAPCLN